MPKSKLPINFSDESNRYAYHLYRALLERGITDDEMDLGWTENKNTETHTNDSYSMQGTNGLLEANEIIEYALNNDQKYFTLLCDTFGEPPPWSLDDSNPTTIFDEKIRTKIQQAIDILNTQIIEAGIVPGTEDYKERMLVGLFYLANVPDQLYLRSFVNTLLLPDDMRRFLSMQELVDQKLDSYKQYLLANGGFGISDGDNTEEYSALDAIANNIGNCTEKSKILFAILRMAGLEPCFVAIDAAYLQQDLGHSCVGVDINGSIRILDSSALNSNATYKEYDILTLRQYYSSDYVNRGYAWQAGGDVDRALDAYAIALMLDSKNEDAYFNSGNAWSDKGNFEKAIGAYSNAIEFDPQNHKLYANRGKAWFKTGHFDEAISDFTQALKIDEHDANTYYDRGTAWLEKKNYEQAITDFNKAIEENPNLDIAFYNRGRAWKAKQDITKALEDYSKAIDINPIFESAYNNRGNLYLGNGFYDKAIADFSKLIEINPSRSDAYSNRGLAWSGVGEYSKAIEDYDKALLIEPSNIHAYVNRGVAWVHMGEIHKAFDDYNKALQINPNFSHAYANRANLFLQTGNLNSAMTDIAFAMNSKPDMSSNQLYSLVENNFLSIFESDEETKLTMTSFGETGLSLVRVVSCLFFSYCLWEANQPEKAKELFVLIQSTLINKIAGVILTTTSKAVLLEYLQLMPLTMQTDEQLRDLRSDLEGALNVTQ